MDLPVWPILIRLTAVLVLVAANGIFVAAEFAIVAVRRTRLIPLVERGSRTARMVLRTSERPDAFIAATQLGITMASLALGWIGEPAVAGLLAPALAWLPGGLQEATAHTIAVILAFALITMLHIVLGEQAPKSVALWRPEATALFVTPATELFHRVFRPFIWLLTVATGGTLAAVGLRAPTSGRHIYSSEEIGLLVTESRRAGVVEEEEARLVHRVFKFADRLVEEVMVPRVQVRGVPADAAVADAVAAIREAGYTRLPVFEEDLDHIVGMVHAKDLLLAPSDRPSGPVAPLMRPVLYIPEMKPVVDLLEEMRRGGIQLAVVLDEFGGTSGIVTIEDLLEELVGEIPGEFRREQRLIVLQQPERIVVDAAIPLDALNDAFRINLPAEEANTLGGFVFHHLGAIPEPGATFRVDQLEFKIETASRTRIGLVQIRRLKS